MRYERYGNKAVCCIKNTMKLWRQRSEKDGMSGLSDRRDITRNIPHKTSKEEAPDIVLLRYKVTRYGPLSLKMYFWVGASEEDTIKKILKNKILTKRKRKKYQKRNDLKTAGGKI